MSGPFRFQAEEARSPLDRSASPFSAGQPVSFKTNVNRAKTKKWVQAKKNAYDGDDWGDYDEYDEYGVNQEPEQPQPPAQRYYAQRTEQPSRSFTDPSQQPPILRGRRNSFEQGEEQRAFSSTIPHPQHNHGQQYEEPRVQTSGGGFEQGYDTGNKDDFSPSAVPPPLQTRISQVPAGFTPPINTQFPPRKSSIGQGDMPLPVSPRSRQGSSSDKPLPFVRPADIYKRHEEERQRASLESSRPSLDSLSSPTRDNTTSQEGGRSLQPMETVAERKSEYYLPDYDAAAPHHDKQQSQQDPSLVSPHDDRGLRSVVDQAFTRADELRSVPPTPISNDNDSSSDLLRSNTGSTSGISPIMSRVPSSAASALRNRNQAEGNTPAIAEEPSETTTPITQPTPANVIEPMHHVPRKPSPGHNRNFSNSSIPRSGLATPTRGDSPARSPVLASSRDVPEPESVLVTTESNETSDTMEGGLQGPSSAYATREADIATAARNGSDSGAPELGAAELRSQNTFLESHNAQSPIDDVLPRDRSESPSKGRVQALAGKFGEVASSRRGSTQSNRSRNSLQSWERSNDNSRAASPTKASHSRHSSPVKEFRPHLPGQWESYATSAMTPSDQGEQDRGLSLDTSGSNTLNKSDLTPTTPKHPVAGVSSSETETSDPIAALRDAGAAMVNSIRTTLGVDDNTSETQQQQERRANHGNIYLPRPLQLDRTVTSNSSAPPTPPAKDTPESEFPPPAPLKERSSQPFNSQEKRPSLDPQLSTDPSAEDQESDRLRKEIVASLSPFKAPASPTSESNRASLQPVSPGTNRASSILPSEYDTYWAEEDRASRRSSQNTERHPQEQPIGKTVSFLPQSEEPTKPVILNRFSWEGSNSQLQTPEEQAEGAPTAEPTKTSQVAATPSPPIERAADQERQEPSEPLPDSYFGPGHTFTVTKPDPVSDTDMSPQPSSPPLDSTRSLASPITSPTREDTRSPGLHVVNTELNPEAVDLPPRFSAEHDPPPEPKEPELSEKQQLEQPKQHPALASPSENPTTPVAAQDSSPKSPTADKPLGAREIATLATPAERIAAYNATREYWAKYDHGLNDWLRAALEANPDLAIQSYPVQRVPTTSARHRHTGSLALFGKLGGSSTHDVSAEQHNNASVPVPTNSSSPTAAAPSGSGFGGRIANQQMQLKGKDLLHTANVLGGKGMTSAKGLFAKGKSRFGREKTSHARADSAPSSREASEEPELVTRRSRASTGMHLIRSMTEKEMEKKEEAPNEGKKKRRFSFSSQLRRASRSRSRPSSVALPKDTPSVFSSTPKTSPPRELHHYLMGDRRPHSFHAPDSWVSTPPTALNEYFSTTPPRRSSSQSRLGILPSPAKSAFSNQDRDTGNYVPPVPPIPNEVATKHYRRRSSQDSASHQILQSVVRHSTPPIVSNRHSTPAAVTRDPNSREHHPVFTEDDPPASAQERADDYKILLRAPEGSFQPDLPTAESGDPQRDGFHFGFSDGTSKSVKHEDIDDDDQPPQLNHDPLPASSQVGLQEPLLYTNRHMDVSDEDSDREPVRGRGLAPLPTLESKQKADSISPILPPVGTSAGDLPSNDNTAIDVKQDEEERRAKIIRYEDTPFVLIPQQADNVVTTEQSSMDTTGALPSLPSQRRINELSHSERRIGYGDRASDVDSPTLGLLEDTPRTGKVRRIPSFEAEVIATRDATPTSDASSDVRDDQTASRVEKTDVERAFSPVWFAKSDLQLPNTSPPRLGDADGSAQVRATTFAKERDENARSLPTPSEAIGEIAALAQQQIRRHGEISLSHTLAGAANADSDTSTRRVSTPPSQGVDAVEGYPASDPVDTSWNHRDTIESRVITGAPDKMRDESDRVTPVAQAPRITQDGPETPKAEDLHNENSHPVRSNGYFHGQANFPDFKHQAQQLQVSNNAAAAPERSRSILSQISAMVSDEGSNPYSQTSTGRSTPSTIRRMQPDSTIKPSAAPPQIPEEVLTSYVGRTASGGDDDFDLYADHNGVVKDVQDESGRPLRLADLQVTGTASQPHPSRPSTSDIGSAPASRDGGHPRYSFERPMSFISGPEDQDGKPQDQINQAAVSKAMQVPPGSEQHRHQSQQSRQMETLYSMNPPASMVSTSDHLASRNQPIPASGPAPSKNIFQAVKSIDPGSKTTQATISSWRPSGESVSQQMLSENSNISRQPQQTSQLSDRVSHEPQGNRMLPGQSIHQSTLGCPQGQGETLEAQPYSQANGPRNQFELHQQMLQRQAQLPRHEDAEFRPPITSSHPSAEQSPRQQEKPSKPRFSSMLKNLGGKAQATSQHPPSAGSTSASSESKPLAPNPTYGGPVQSVMDRFARPREASAERPIEQPRSFVPPNRPSMGQQPQFIQTPLTVPSTDPHRDLGMPITSAPSNGFPPQQPSPMSNAQVQPHQVPQSGTPENGKKKRFSAFGALFSRGASGDGLTTKYKLSKEGKKAPKGQQSFAGPLAQPPASQRLPQQQSYKPQQSGLAYYPPGQLPPHTVQNGPPMGPKLGPSQPAPSMHPQGPPRQYQQMQQVPPPRNSISNTRPNEGSAFLKTKQLAMEHQARQSSLQSHGAHKPNTGTAAHSSSMSSGNVPPHTRHPSSGPPPGGYYDPHAEQASVERGAYAASVAARQEAEQRLQQHTPQQGAHVVPQTERQHEVQQSAYEQNIFRDPRHAQQPEQQAQPELSREQLAHQAWLAQREQIRQQEQHANEHDGSWPNDDARVQQLRHHQQREQSMDQSVEQRQPNNTQPLPYHNASDPRFCHPSQDAVPISPPAVSPMQEPRYEAPPIPAAYHPVSGAFMSPLDRQQHNFPGQFDRHDSEPRMQTVSPQVSAQSQAPPNGRSHSDASTISLVSPISNSPALPSSSPAPGGQRYQKSRMSSISEVHQQDRPWHLNFPEGATEQEIVRARQGQYMQERFTAQQQQQAERAAGSPSPRATPEQTTPTTVPPHTQAHGGGFRELLPRASSQPYAESQDAQASIDLQPIIRRDETPVQPTPIRPGQSPPPAAYPLPMSPDPTVISSPVNPVASGYPPPPPPKIAHSPIRPGFPSPQPFSFEEQRQHTHMSSSRDDGYGSPPRLVPQYDEQVPDEAPPSYDGPGTPNDGMNKSRPEALRPPNITTNLEYESRGRQPVSRPRQPSIGILQHPQPASMAASPQRTSPDMGAESLRRQLLQQENLAHMERVQREQEQRERQERERQEREAARARARELERSVSGGGQVPSLRIVGSSTTGGAPGWERRGSHSRPVFELPAVEDDEPTMKATSYPGQEWVPPMWDGD